jgi:hypothetical protein
MTRTLHQRAERPSADPALADPGRLLARGVCRALQDHGLATLTEFTLGSGRRVDVIGLDRRGQVTIVEIKTCLEDFRSDRKWPEYLAFCDRFFFAVAEDFPRRVLPADCGLMTADPYSAVILRESADFRRNAARRRAQGLRFGLVAAERLGRLVDPR